MDARINVRFPPKADISLTSPNRSELLGWKWVAYAARAHRIWRYGDLMAVLVPVAVQDLQAIVLNVPLAVGVANFARECSG